jgi:hypothetical protein
MELDTEEWVRKGATLSDKSVRAEFGLTQDEIIAAIRTGKPWCRLGGVATYGVDAAVMSLVRRGCGIHAV